MQDEAKAAERHGKSAAIVVRQAEPFNAGPPPELICSSFITPTELFFSRNHAPLPDLDAEGYALEVGGLVGRPLRLTLAELRERFPRAELTATLVCAGNRRDELLALGPIPGEVPWGSEALSTARWAGAPLREVLLAAGLHAGAAHVAFEGLDAVAKQGGCFGLGGSLPLEKALGPEVLLAYEMNGAALTPAHGYPLRVLAPGYIGARSVKWLASITVQPEPSDNYFQAQAYRLFPPEVRPETAEWARGEMLGPITVNAVICQPVAGAQVAAGPLELRGYALAAEGATVAAVEVSCDGGASWQQARLLEEQAPWAWRLWEASLTLGPGEHELLARARDTLGNTMPAELAQVWNFKGYMNNAWHGVRVAAR
jgi:sulfite oxidase